MLLLRLKLGCVLQLGQKKRIDLCKRVGRGLLSLLKLPDTGQTVDATSTFGEDSDYTINAPSYTDNGDGTITDTAYLTGAANNFLLAVVRGREARGVALLDVSTGEFWVGEDGEEHTYTFNRLYREVNRFGNALRRLGVKRGDRAAFTALVEKWKQPVMNFVFGTLRDEIESEDVVNGLLRYASGATGVIQGSTAFWPGYPERVEFHGTKGSAVLTADRLTAWDVEGDDLSDVPLARDLA